MPIGYRMGELMLKPWVLPGCMIMDTSSPASWVYDTRTSVLNATDEEIFNVQKLSNFAHEKIEGSFNKPKCEGCGEYVFDRYVRIKDGKNLCIPCTEY